MVNRSTGAVLAASVLWGTTGTVAHFAPAGSDPLLIGLSTFGFGALILLLVDRRRALVLLARRDARGPLALGALGVGLYAACYYPAMDLVGVAVGNVLALGSGPVFAALLELVVDRRRVSRAWTVATALALAGITVLALTAHSGNTGGSPATESAAEAGGANRVLAGVLLALVAGFGYALYSFVAARLIAHGHPSRPVMAAMFTAAAVVLLPWFVIAGPGPLLHGSGPVVLAYLAIAPMAAAYLLFGYGLRGMTASSATTLALAEPVVATVLAVVVVGERLSPAAWSGMAAIVAALVLIGLAERRAPSTLGPA